MQGSQGLIYRYFPCQFSVYEFTLHQKIPIVGIAWKMISVV